MFLNVCPIVHCNLRNTSAFQPEGIIRHGSPTDGLELTRHTSIVQWKPHQWAECGKALERRIPVTGSLIHTPTKGIPQRHRGKGTRCINYESGKITA